MKSNFQVMQEELGIPQDDEQDVVQIGATDTVSESDLRDLQCAQQLNAADRIDIKQETVVGLESLERAIGKENPHQLSKLTLRLANAAIGTTLERANIDLQSMPFNPNDLDERRQETIDDGLDNLRQQKKTVFESIRQDLAIALSSNIKQKDVLQRLIDELWKRWHVIDDRISRGALASAQKQTAFYVGDHSALQYLLYSGQIVNNAASVASDFTHFLTEHSHLFKRLIKKQTDWVNDHKGNVLKDLKGTLSYSFNPTEYRCTNSVVASAEKLQEVDSATVSSMTTQLPGMVSFFTHTCKETVFGNDAVVEFGNSSCELGLYDPEGFKTYSNALKDVNVSSTYVVPQLSKEELVARLEETKRAIEALEHWVEVGFTHIWKEACFEHFVLSVLIDESVKTTNQMFLASLALATLKQLINATKDVGGYGYKVIEGLLTYVELNVEAFE